MIDLHCHFDMLETDPEETIRIAQAAGVDRMVTIGTEAGDHPYVLDLARKYFPVVACTLGVHPHHGSAWTPEIESFIRRHALEPGVIAVGEIGLDYYYTQSPVEEQKSSFRRQMELAEELKLPVQIHTREAESDTTEILQDFKGRVGGIIHCFTSSIWLARECLDLGFNISFSGIVTFKNAEALRDVCRFVPLDRMHVETDAPFLAPVPQRGKKNTPAYVQHTADFVAHLKGVPRPEFDEQMIRNARRVFPKLQC